MKTPAKNSFAVLSVLLLLTFIACRKSSTVACSSSFNFHAELTEESQKLSVAASNYGMDPTTENCLAYKSAYQDYLNEAKKWKDCAETQGQGAEYLQSIEAAEQSLEDLQC